MGVEFGGFLRRALLQVGFVLQLSGPVGMLVLAETVDAGIKSRSARESGRQRSGRFLKPEAGKLEFLLKFVIVNEKAKLFDLSDIQMVKPFVETVKCRHQPGRRPAGPEISGPEVRKPQRGGFAGIERDAAGNLIVKLSPRLTAECDRFDLEPRRPVAEIADVNRDNRTAGEIEISPRLRFYDNAGPESVDGGRNGDKQFVAADFISGLSRAERLIMFRPAAGNVEQRLRRRDSHPHDESAQNPKILHINSLKVHNDKISPCAHPHPPLPRRGWPTAMCD